VLAVFNLSPKPVEVTLNLPKKGTYQEYFSGENVKLKKEATFPLDKWEVKIFIRQ
jgi:hypothetical protein